MLSVCPTDIVAAPAERIWDLIATTDELARWSDTRPIDAPDGEVREGDRLVLGAGIGHSLRVIFHVRKAVRPRTLMFDIRLPLGVKNAETIEITPVGPAVCRVTFNWMFEFPPGWRGRVIKTVLGRQFITGPADALARLKRAAERQ